MLTRYKNRFRRLEAAMATLLPAKHGRSGDILRVMDQDPECVGLQFAATRIINEALAGRADAGELRRDTKKLLAAMDVPTLERLHEAVAKVEARAAQVLELECAARRT